MLHRLLHPADRVLSDFADRELPEQRARDVAAHVAGCARCHEFVWSCRRLDAAAQEPGAPALDAAVRQRVVDRRAAGEDVVLPVPQPAAAAPGRRAQLPRVAVFAGVVALAGAAGALLVGTPQLTAEASELTITPAAPQPGDTIRVAYRATSRLSGHDELVLRARHRRPNSVMDATEYSVLARLTKQRDGTYAGAFVLPEGVQHAVLAVEDAAARDVDHHGERWEVLLHGPDGVPLERALDLQIRDVINRNSITAAEHAAELVRLYPNSINARTIYHSRLVVLLDEERVDSLRAAHREVLHRLLAAQSPPALDADELANVIFHAAHVGDTTTMLVYRDELIARFPLSPAAQQQRVFVLANTRARDTAAFWAGLERLWEETAGVPRHAQIAFSGWQSAQQSQDVDGMARWGRRIVEDDGGSYWIGQAFAHIPSLREEGIALIEAYLAAMDDGAENGRDLTHTADEHRALRNRHRGRVLAELGVALAAAGRQEDADRALARAVDLAWQPQLFRSVADARLAAGDTAAALPLLARVAVDPSTPAAFGDTARARVGARFEEARWAELQADAIEDMRRHIMFLATNRAVQGRPRLRDAGGGRQTLDTAAEGMVTFVAFWSRHCPPSHMQMRQVAELARTLQEEGARVVTITDERPSDRLATYIGEQGLDATVLYDMDGEARRAFDSFGTPTYLVLDTQGRVRFRSHELEDVRRQVWLLRGGVRSATR